MATPPTRQVFTQLLPVMKPGQSILVESPQSTCTSYAAQTGQKIRTNRVIVVDDTGGQVIATVMTRVTKV